MNVNVDEQETVIRIGRCDKEVDIWTSDTTMMTKLDKLCESSPAQYTTPPKTGDNQPSKTYKIADKTLISFRSKKTERKMTEEQRRQAAERLKSAREKRNG